MGVSAPTRWESSRTAPLDSGCTMRPLSQTRTACPICFNSQCNGVGEIYHAQPALIAGSAVDLCGTSFELRCCDRCAFQFKSPAISELTLAECYANSSDDLWGKIDADGGQRFRSVRNVLKKFGPARSILDIGCHNGAFLKTLRDEYTLFGVEPSRKAAEKAAANGVHILGQSIFGLDPTLHHFDRITVLDVVEHLLDPMPFLTRARDLLRPGGVLLIQTGDSAAWQWRLERNLHWYCSLPEHVSFYCAATFDFMAAQLGMERLYYRRIRQRRSTLVQRTIETSKNLGFMAANRLRGLRLRRLAQIFLCRRAPVWITARDHMLYACQKPFH